MPSASTRGETGPLVLPCGKSALAAETSAISRERTGVRESANGRRRLGRLSCQRGLVNRFVGVALSHQFAALLAVGVKMVALGRRHELTDLFQASKRQPPLAPASLNGKAVRCLFIWTPELVTALVGMNPEFARCGL